MKQTLIRNFVFGAEDSLVSTVGLLAGIAMGGVPKPTIILTGIILISVEAFSMGVGSYLSEFITTRDKSSKQKLSGSAGVIMLISYFITGFIPLSPFIFFEGTMAFWLSIFFSVTALLILGIVGSYLSHTKIIRNTLRMVLLGGSAITIGIVVSMLIP